MSTTITLNKAVVSSQESINDMSFGSENINSSRYLWTYYYISSSINLLIKNASLNGLSNVDIESKNIYNLGDSEAFIEFMTNKKYTISFIGLLDNIMSNLGEATPALPNQIPSSIPAFQTNIYYKKGQYIKYSNSIYKCVENVVGDTSTWADVQSFFEIQQNRNNWIKDCVKYFNIRWDSVTATPNTMQITF